MRHPSLKWDRLSRYTVYALLLCGSSVAAFGGAGLIVTVVVSAFWGVVFTRRNRPIAFFFSTCLFLLALLLLMCIAPAIQPAREAARRAQCLNNLRNVGLAVWNYSSTEVTLPLAQSWESNDAPPFSWRVAILPMIDQVAIYERYDFNQPWDGPDNAKLIPLMPDDYICPEEWSEDRSKNGYTTVFAVAGDRTIWPEAQRLTFDDVPDSLGTTALFVECRSKKVPWTKPEDLTVDEVITSLIHQRNGGHLYSTYFYHYDLGAGCVFVDGHVERLGGIDDPEVLRSLFLIDDGGPDADWIKDRPRHYQSRRIRWGNWISFGSFVFMALFPLPWVWLGQKKRFGHDATSTDDTPNSNHDSDR